MEWSYPWLSIDEDRLYDDGDFARFYAGLFSDGVSLTTADGLKVGTNPTGGMRVQIQAGAAFIGGRSYFNSTALALQLDVASSSQDRTDSIVLHMDAGMREIKLIVKKGSTQVTRTDDIFELQLATIKVPRNSSTITADLIMDKRADDTVCGYCTPYQDISVSGMEEQYRAMLQLILDTMTTYAETSKEQFETDMQSILDDGTAQLENQSKDWQIWFENIKEQLDGDVAGNLQNQINKLKSDQLIYKIRHETKGYPLVQVTAWQDGLGITGIGESTWAGTDPVTIPATVTYHSWNDLSVAVPIDYKLSSPTITETEHNNFLLVEGNKSLRIKLIGVN